jgi:hypothetical protein
MHVVAQIGRNEIVSCDRVIGQITLKFCVRSNVIGAIRGRQINVIEVDERIVKRGVKSAARRWTSRPADVFLVRFPRYSGVLKLNHKMVRRREVMRRWITAVARHAPIRSRLQPKILRQTPKRSWDNEHIAGVRRLGQKEIVDVWRIRAASDVRPTHIFHHNQENGLDVGVARGVTCASKEHHPHNDNSQPLQSHPLTGSQILSTKEIQTFDRNSLFSAINFLSVAVIMM